jgi:signal transduction histidine kinase
MTHDKEAPMNEGDAISGELEELLKKRDRQRAEFVATVSHDLKTPLNAVIGFCSVLMQGADKMDRDSAHQLGMISGSARQLLDRINDLLEFYRLEGGKIAVQLLWVSPVELMLQAVEPFRAGAAAQGVELVLEKEKAPGRLRSDARLLLRVIREFVSNALKFTRSGKIMVSSEVLPSEDTKDLLVRFSVADSGMGIQANQLAAITSSLKSGSRMLDRSYAGLGLGLALCREVSILLNGRIEAESSADHGSIFSLVLKLRREDVG